jgi:hypothetical protein
MCANTLSKNWRHAILTLAALAAVLSGQARAAENDGAFEVHELALWILDPGAPMANARAAYPSALPVTINSLRGVQSPEAQAQIQQRALLVGGNRRVVVNGNLVIAGAAPVGAANTAAAPPLRKTAPINLITFHGQPTPNLDIELRTSAGNFLAHWPPGEGFPNRLRWAGNPSYDLVDKADPNEMMFVGDDHWFTQARRGDALYLKRGTRAERFLAYDVELNLTPPIKLAGGPNEFTVVNTSGATLYDVLISRFTPEGRRIAWIDELPPATPAPAPEKPKPAAAEKPKAQAVEGLFAEAPAAEAPAVAAPAQPPAEAPAVEAPAAPPVAAPAAAEAPSVEAPARPAAGATKPQLFGGLPKELKEKLPAKPGAGGKPVLFGGLPAAKPADGVPVKLSDPIPHDQLKTDSRAVAALGDRLRKAGLAESEVAQFSEHYGEVFFQGEALVIACRLDPAAVDEKVALSVFPKPSKTVRVALVVVRDADPQLGEQLVQLIAKLGDPKFSEREAAQRRLLELGPLAFPALTQALSHSDPEVVIRAERILLTQNQTPNPSQAPRSRNGVIQAAPAVIIQN